VIAKFFVVIIALPVSGELLIDLSEVLSDGGDPA
jgi:hypothetical protein